MLLGNCTYGTNNLVLLPITLAYLRPWIASYIKRITRQVKLLVLLPTYTIEIKCLGNPSTWTLLRFASSNTNFQPHELSVHLQTFET